MSQCIWIECEQGSPEWIAARLGLVTASRFGDVMRTGRAGEPLAAWKSYQTDLLCERLTNVVKDEIHGKPLAWGKKYEPAARAAYTWATDNLVDQVGFAIWGDLLDVGASSDGLIETDGCIEIKCPYDPANHLRTLITRQVPNEYVWQVHGNLLVLDRQWCDYVSYRPDMPEDKQVVIVRVDRDEKMDAKLIPGLHDFVERLNEMFQRINEAVK